MLADIIEGLSAMMGVGIFGVMFLAIIFGQT